MFSVYLALISCDSTLPLSNCSSTRWFSKVVETITGIKPFRAPYPDFNHNNWIPDYNPNSSVVRISQNVLTEKYDLKRRVATHTHTLTGKNLLFLVTTLGNEKARSSSNRQNLLLKKKKLICSFLLSSNTFPSFFHPASVDVIFIPRADGERSFKMIFPFPYLVWATQRKHSN